MPMAASRDLGLAALQRGELTLAVEYLEAACAHDPTDYKALLFLGGAYHQSKRDVDAVQVLTEAVQLRPDDAHAYYNLGIALERLHRYDEAVASLSRALALQPDYKLAAQ